MGLGVTIAIIGLITPSKIHGDESTAVKPQLNQLDVLTATPTPEEIKEAIVFVAVKYGLNENELLTTLKCESSLVYNARGDWNGEKYLAVGVAQFHFPTWADNCSGDYYSTKDQLICTAEMWQRNMQHHWSCYNNIFGG